MKYYPNQYPYQATIWNQFQNSTQNSSSNLRVYNHHIIKKKSNQRKRKGSFYSSISSNIPSVSSFNTQDKGHYQFSQGEVLAGNYRITKLLGEGTFGRVVQAEANHKKYAIKIIRPVDRYINSAKIQKKIIKQINSRDPQDKQGIVKYIHSFYHKNHLCLTFKPLGKSLYDIIKLNHYQGFPIYYVQCFFKQILQSISFLHKIGYTHTDLKPQNILLQQEDLLKIEGFTKQTQQIFLPKCQKVRIIDFGGATKYNQFHSSIICTRQYRPPEVILKCTQWNQNADVWSIACIVAQLFNGNLLFPTHNDFQHLIMMQKHLGQFPSWMIRKAEEDFKSVFQNGEICYQKAQKYFSSWRNINNLKTVDEIFIEHEQLKDLIKKCLQIDPNRRINCKKALQHQFFNISYK